MRKFYVALAAAGALVAAMGAFGGLAVWDEARHAMAEAAAYEHGAAALRADVRAFASDLPPGLPGDPGEYEAFLAASRDVARAAEEYAAALRAAAADGWISGGEDAEIRAADEAFLRAEREADAALLESPAGRMAGAGWASEDAQAGPGRILPPAPP